MRRPPRVFYGNTRQRNDRHLPDPYGTSSPDYAERNRLTAVEIAPGLIVESYGAPIPRLAGEAQPVDLGTPEVAQPEPEAVPVVAPVVTAALSDSSRPRSWRDDYGVARLA